MHHDDKQVPTRFRRVASLVGVKLAPAPEIHPLFTPAQVIGSIRSNTI